MSPIWIDFTVKSVFYTVIICFQKCSTVYRCTIPSGKDNYIHSSACIRCLSVVFHILLSSIAPRVLKSSAGCQCCMPSGLALANDVPREEWWDSNPTVLITFQCWCPSKFVTLMFLALITFLCHITSRQNNTYLFSFPLFLGFFYLSFDISYLREGRDLYEA